MRIPFRRILFLLAAILVVGCGKKPASDGNTPVEPKPNTEPGAPAETPPPTPASIEGTYLIVGGEMMGHLATDEEIAKDSELERTVKISKDQIQLNMAGRLETFNYKLDPSKSPQEFDLIFTDPRAKSKVSYGIYKVEGDKITFFAMGAKEPKLRPREFKTLNSLELVKAGKEPGEQVGGFLLFTIKKVSNDTTFINEPPPPPKPTPKPPVADEDEPIAAELTKLGLTATVNKYGKFAGVDVVVHSASADAIKSLSGRPRVRTITFRWSGTDADIQSLKNLDNLYQLKIEDCRKLTPAAFRDLSRFPTLTNLGVSVTPFDDSVTEELAKVKTLEAVELDGSKFTDKAFENLAKIKTLTALGVDSSKVSVAAIKQLNELPNLTWLRAPLNDDALAALNMPKVETLMLARGYFKDAGILSDAGLGKLRIFPNLGMLQLEGDKITEAGLQHILKQPKLTSLTLLNTKVTKEQAEKVKKDRPKLSISVINF